MRRHLTVSSLARLLADVAAAVSLALAMAVAFLCVRSYWVPEAVGFVYAGERWELASEFGRFRVWNRPQFLADHATVAAIKRVTRDSPATPGNWPAADLHGLLSDAQRAGRRDLARHYHDILLSEQTALLAARDGLHVVERRAQARVQFVPGMGPPPPRRSYALPQWVVVAALAALPAARWGGAAVRRRARRRAAARGVCLACRYDLRATPDRCPECGTAAASHDATRRSQVAGSPRGCRARVCPNPAARSADRRDAKPVLRLSTLAPDEAGATDA